MLQELLYNFLIMDLVGLNLDLSRQPIQCWGETQAVRQSGNYVNIYSQLKAASNYHISVDILVAPGWCPTVATSNYHAAANIETPERLHIRH